MRLCGTSWFPSTPSLLSFELFFTSIQTPGLPSFLPLTSPLFPPLSTGGES
jgi:hypothetical protein